MSFKTHLFLALLLGSYIATNVAVFATVSYNSHKLKKEFNESDPIYNRTSSYFTNNQNFIVEIGDTTKVMQWSEIWFEEVSNTSKTDVKIVRFERPTITKDNRVLILFPIFFCIKSNPIFKIDHI